MTDGRVSHEHSLLIGKESSDEGGIGFLGPTFGGEIVRGLDESRVGEGDEAVWVDLEKREVSLLLKGFQFQRADNDGDNVDDNDDDETIS